jgi:hypothetical protein
MTGRSELIFWFSPSDHSKVVEVLLGDWLLVGWSQHLGGFLFI